MPESKMLEVGRVGRPHGTRGEVVVQLVSNRTERLDNGSVLSTPSGPLTVVSARPHKGAWLVRFSDVADRSGAEKLRGLVLRAEPIHDPDELWVHDLVGAAVTDQRGVFRGRVSVVVANPASDLLELDSGALVPIRFVVSVDPGMQIRVEVPPGLFDLHEGDAVVSEVRGGKGRLVAGQADSDDVDGGGR